MSFKLYVGNLSYNLEVEELRECFSKAGEVVYATIIKDRVTGNSRGFGFVEFSSQKEQETALKMGGTEVAGRPLYVAPAREPRSKGQYKNSPHHGEEKPSEKNREGN